ncbi:hypothetical protein [Microbacterium deminutum]|uniref:hypothetical protein n=1 Tax=Microbacterium deminutum TaxID=344164 RepID=UPI0031E46A46
MDLRTGRSDELDELRARVYGPTPEPPPTEDEIARLLELEAAQSQDIGLAPPSVEVRAIEEEPDKPDLADLGPSGPAEDGHRFSVRLIPWAVAVISGSLIAGFAVGAAVSTPKPDLVLPEFARPQTDEDILSVATQAQVQPLSTRFIARVDGFDIYLARPTAYNGTCIVVTSRADNGSPNTACGHGSDADVTMNFGITSRLGITVGDPSTWNLGGKEFALSESVSAWRS